jgi:hypothetical protein
MLFYRSSLPLSRSTLEYLSGVLRRAFERALERGPSVVNSAGTFVQD